MYKVEISYFNKMLKKWYKVNTVYTNSKTLKIGIESWLGETDAEIFFLAEESIT